MSLSATEKLMEGMNRMEELMRMVDPPYLRSTRELLRQQSLYQQYFDSPVQRLLRELAEVNKIRSALDSPAMQYLRQLQEHQGLIGHMMQTLQERRGLHSALLPFYTATSHLDRLGLFGNAFGDLQTSSTSFMGGVLHELSEIAYDFDVEDESCYDDVVRKINGLVDYFVEKCSTLPKGKVTFEGMLGILLTVIFSIQSIMSSNTSTKMVMNEIDKAEGRIISAVKNIDSPANENDDFVIDHTTSVRVKPAHKSAKITFVYPNQRVSVLSRQREWVYVQYFDFLESIPKTGWVAKKYVSRIKHLPMSRKSSVSPEK
jgi:hypothetical protein